MPATTSAQPAEDDLDRYRLLASAAAGRNLRVERAPDGEPTYTDGLTIYLEPGQAHADAVAAVVVHGALLAAGSLQRDVLKGMGGRAVVARRYLAVEAPRALAAMADQLPRVPVVAAARAAAPLTSSPQESLDVAVGRGSVPATPAVYGVIRPKPLLAVIAAAEEVADRVTSIDGRHREADLEDPDETSFTHVMEEPAKPPLGESVSKVLKKLTRGKGQRGDAQGGAHVPLSGGRATNRAAGHAPVTVLRAALLPTEVDTERGDGWRYPEWDVREGRYRREWCTVTEVDPPPGDPAAFQDRPLASDLKRRLARLGVGLERHRREAQGDDIDIDAVVEARVEIRRGSSPSDGLYVQSRRRKRSLAVLLLIDASGSAGETSAAMGSVHEHQTQAAALLLDALSSLGDRAAVYGFRSHGRSAVSLIRVKGFEDTLDGATYSRLGALAPGGYTRLGAAIRHGAHMLDTRGGTDRRLLVVLSDGFAYDDGYEGRYGESDARRALAEARRNGVGCLCLSLGAGTDPESLRRVFGTAAHASAVEFADIVGDIGRLFRTAMQSADLQRRLAQRTRRSSEEPAAPTAT